MTPGAITLILDAADALVAIGLEYEAHTIRRDVNDGTPGGAVATLQCVQRQLWDLSVALRVTGDAQAAGVMATIGVVEKAISAAFKGMQL